MVHTGRSFTPLVQYHGTGSRCSSVQLPARSGFMKSEGGTDGAFLFYSISFFLSILINHLCSYLEHKDYPPPLRPPQFTH